MCRASRLGHDGGKRPRAELSLGLRKGRAYRKAEKETAMAMELNRRNFVKGAACAAGMGGAGGCAGVGDRGRRGTRG